MAAGRYCLRAAIATPEQEPSPAARGAWEAPLRVSRRRRLTLPRHRPAPKPGPEGGGEREAQRGPRDTPRAALRGAPPPGADAAATPWLVGPSWGGAITCPQAPPLPDGREGSSDAAGARSDAASGPGDMAAAARGLERSAAGGPGESPSLVAPKGLARRGALLRGRRLRPPVALRAGRRGPEASPGARPPASPKGPRRPGLQAGAGEGLARRSGGAFEGPLWGRLRAPAGGACALWSEVGQVGRKGSTDEDSEREIDIINLPETPETCLQMNLVYQEVIEEKIKEVNILLAQNKEQQEKLTWELAGPRASKSSDGKAMPANVFLGHFMKPYFRDKTSGIGPPANIDAQEKSMQGIKSFEDLIIVKWKSREKLLLRQSVASDRLQHLLQPKLLKLEYLTDKQEKSRDGMERQILAKQIQEVECEVDDIKMLPEEVLLGNRLDKHDWDKIANINFEGTRSAKELKKYWQNSEHPSINKKEWSEEEIEKLKEIAARYKCLSWETIAQELGTQRSAFQCLQKFQAYSKDFKRSEWTPEEDQMLLQLVQEIRVGSHIPYRKIAYYMEGRDPAQLIYRWTKRVDPDLRHGSWAPEEDALLLKAVAKYGERDWYKIRTEVPGRNDIQCRERYLNALHHNIKKGRWSEEEEKKLVELTEKYGVGHWAKIALELPHRSGPQCLSKWKVLVGYQRNKKRKLKQRVDLNLSESSSEDSDLELEEGSSEEEEEEEEVFENPRAETCVVPSIDLWIPTRKNPARVPGELPSAPLLSKGFDVNRRRKPVPGALLVEEDQAADGLQSRMPPPVHVQAKEEFAVEDTGISRNKKDSWRVSLAYVKCVLRRNSYELQRRSREISRKKRFALTSQRRLGKDLVPAAREASRGQAQRDGMWKTTLTRRLMMAVTPWAGSMVQTWALRVKREASHKSKAEYIFKHLQTASLTSTPLFSLFIQLLHIDIDGCMTVIQKRKSRQLEHLKALVGGTGKTHQASPARDPTAQSRLQVGTSKKLIPLKAKESHLPAHPQLAFSPPCPAPKPKTVSQLLREKRLQEWKAKRALPKGVILAPPLLLPSSVMIHPPGVPLIQTGRGGPPAAGLPGPTNGPPLPIFSPTRASTLPRPSVGSNLALLQETMGNRKGSQETATENEEEVVPAGSKVEGDGKEGGLQKECQGVPATASYVPLLPKQSHLLLQGLAAKPHIPVTSLSSTSAEPGAKKTPLLAPAACALGPVGSRQNPLRSAPPLTALLSGSGEEVAKQTLPITLLFTARGLLPMTVVSIPSQGKQPSAMSSLGASPGLSQVAGTSPASPVPVAAGSCEPGQQLQGVSSSSLQKEGTPDLGLSSVPLAPAALADLQSSLPLACPLISPSPSTSLGSGQLRVQSRACLKPGSQNHVWRNCQRATIPEGSNDPPENVCPTPSPLREEKVTPDYSLLSLEDVGAVKEWANGGSVARAPLLEANLPYLPPFLCSLKTLSTLLLSKETLERTAMHLVAPEGQQEDSQKLDLNALREMVRHRLKDNPAYRLLKARFLAAFTFPAALAALSPSRGTTTLSGERWWESSHKGDTSLSSEEEEEEEEEDHKKAARESSGVAERCEEPDTDQFGAPGVRRSTRLRRRRRHL
ncbi:snRNA-activating protein complex subunit 4 [Eublepharis macularius]|uniref:snRNA-activating protein complex subunit 4 n=1 Tax=Eublepharis macularius TaxID=481883 RepID=A0AA97KBQ3_EUBMA|nr:snRNA-activating protein complex subunit 4 [Eublepharis macularius]